MPAWLPRPAVRFWPAVAPRAAPASAPDLPAPGGIVDKRFPRAARLTDGEQYQRVFAKAKRRGDRYFTVLAVPNGVDTARLGMAVARRQLPRAVDRNRIKRIIRDSFRQHRAELAAVDIVVLVRAVAARADNEQLSAALTRQWQRLSRT